MERVKSRSPLVAVLLSVLLPGLGQMYCGNLARGVVFYFGLLLVLVVAGVSGLIASFSGLVAAVAIALACNIVIAADAAIKAARLKEVQLRWYNRWYVYVAAVLLVHTIAEPLLVPTVQFQIIGLRTFRTPKDSMSPALTQGDHFLAKLEGFDNGSPYRGEVVVFDFPGDKTKMFVLRVIGLPGEHFEIKDKQVIINGQPLVDHWGTHGDTRTLPDDTSPRDNLGPITIPEGSVFVMGDNRDFAFDSRFWGCVEIKDIHAKALFIYWSEDFKRLGKRI